MNIFQGVYIKFDIEIECPPSHPSRKPDERGAWKCRIKRN
jgi:hypothetical protein